MVKNPLYQWNVIETSTFKVLQFFRSVIIYKRFVFFGDSKLIMERFSKLSCHASSKEFVARHKLVRCQFSILDKT